jgi:hypothetical protein
VRHPVKVEGAGRKSYTCHMTTGIKAQPDFSRDSLLWLAGLLEGEGSFMSGPPSHPNSPIIAVQMTDEDVVARVAQAFGVACVPCAIRTAQWRQTYHARLRGESAVRLMHALRPFMGKRRQAQIDKALASWKPQVRKMRPEDEKRVLELVASGDSYREIGRKIGVSYTTVGNVVKRNQGVLAQSGLERCPVTAEAAGSNPVAPA